VTPVRDSPSATLSHRSVAAYRGVVRTHGLVDHVPGAGPADHLCWIYENDADLDAAARRFLTDGLERGERVLCVGERVIESLRTMSPPVPDLAAALERGAVETMTLDQAYAAAGPTRPEPQLAYYDTATRRALSDGYRGLRVIAEVSGLAMDPVQRADLVQWEQLTDQYAVRGAGFAAMCAYRSDLTGEALGDVAAVHPVVRSRAEVSSFRFFVDGDRLALAGSADTFCSERLARVLAACGVTGGAVLDVAGLEFIDVGACRVLARWGADLQARSIPLAIIGATALLQRMWRVLALDRIAPVTFAESAT